jgi:hypothetical protein
VRKEKGMVDYLFVGYDNVEGDIPTLLVARKTKHVGERVSNTEILRQYQNKEAVEIYELLTGGERD